MVSRSTILHLRIPFSFFLLPVYLFALAISAHPRLHDAVWTFVIIHFLLYPASNAYNSYFDKDEQSIGGLKNPPPVKRELYYTALALDFIAIMAGFILINMTFAVMLLAYGIVSKMYSHPSIRIKRYAILAWAITGLFQGLFSLVMCYVGINNEGIFSASVPEVYFAGAVTSIMLWGNYPMTQIYQHEEDKKHNDYTLSLMLGIKGTFIFVQIVFSLAAVAFVVYFRSFFSNRDAWIFLCSLIPVIIFFMSWFIKAWKDERKADFTNAMKLNLISSSLLNAFFVYLWFSVHSGS